MGMLKVQMVGVDRILLFPENLFITWDLVLQSLTNIESCPLPSQAIGPFRSSPSAATSSSSPKFQAVISHLLPPSEYLQLAMLRFHLRAGTCKSHAPLLNCSPFLQGGRRESVAVHHNFAPLVQQQKIGRFDCGFLRKLLYQSTVVCKSSSA